MADGLVYGMASVSNGIAEGWGSKAAMPGTSFALVSRLSHRLKLRLGSQEEYRMPLP